jgi:glycosyltransferase involved in cell wall biosynthesis
MQILHSIKQPDYIIARSSDGILCALFSSIFSLRTKIILHNHGWEEKVYEVEKRLPKSAISNATSWKSHFLRFPLLRLNLSLAKFCICGTIEEARWISNKYPSVRKKLIVIPNGITKTERPYWPSLKDLPPSFLIIGGFTWKKNIEYGINLFFNIQKLLPEARLFIIGTGKIPSVKTTLLDSIGDAVYTVERERPDNMRRWYETCPYLISTSRYEGGRPYGILEAQAKGMVVFSTDIPSVREFIFSNKNGVFLTGSEMQTDTTRIINTCNNVALVKKIGENGWKSASRSSIDRQVKRLEKILI